jgi:hypothetical protein
VMTSSRKASTCFFHAGLIPAINGSGLSGYTVASGKFAMSVFAADNVWAAILW